MQRRRRYDLKLSGLTGHVLDLFLLLTHYWICLQLIWLTGWETLCANYMAMSIWFALLERYDI